MAHKGEQQKKEHEMQEEDINFQNEKLGQTENVVMDMEIELDDV